MANNYWLRILRRNCGEQGLHSPQQVWVQSSRRGRKGSRPQLILYPLHVLLDGLCASFSSYHIFLVKVGIRKCFEDPLELETAVSKCHFCSLLCLKRGRKGKKSVCICSLPYLFYKTLSQSQNKSLKGI